MIKSVAFLIYENVCIFCREERGQGPDRRDYLFDITRETVSSTQVWNSNQSEKDFQINGHCASFQTIPATGVESRVSSEEEKQSACPSETVPAENSSETRQLILSMNFCTEPSSCCLKSVPLLCNYKSLWTGVLPALSIFLFFYVKLSRVWTCSKAGTNTCIISCCCFRQSSLKY